MLARIRRFLDVRPGEEAPLFFSFLYVAVAVGSFLLAKAIRNGLFLQAYEATKLVYVYIGVPVVLSILVPLYGLVAARVGHRKVVTGSLLFLCLNVLGFWWSLTTSRQPWLAAAFYIWVNCYGVIAPVQAWSFANAVFDTRQARRLFGLVGSGASVGAIAGGFLARVLVTWTGTVNLLIVLAGMIAATALIVNMAWHVRRDAQRSAAAPAPRRSRRRPVPFGATLQLIATTPYLRRISMLVVLVAITTQWTQFQFQAIAQATFAGDADRLTRFFGDFNSAMGVLALLVQVFGTGPALRKFGLGVTILLLPVMLGVGVLGIFLTGALWAVLFTNAVDQGLRFSVDKASFELLYLPIASGMRDRVKSTIDLIINRVADAIGGVVLGLATTGFAVMALRIPGAGLGLRGIAALTLICIAGWVAVALRLRNGYVEAIRESISQHRIDIERPSNRMLDREVTDMLASRLSAGDPGEIIYALDLFRLQHRGSRHPAVRGLLTYPAPEVRRRAVAVLDESGDRSATSAVEALLDDPDAGVRAEALIYLAHHAEIDPLQKIGTLTAFEDYSLQAGLVAFLGRPGAWQNIEAARLILDQMISNDGANRTRARLEAARLMAQLPAEFEPELATLLTDGNEEVVRAALSAAARPEKARLASAVIGCLSRASLREVTGQTLTRMGRAVVPHLRAFMEDTSVSPVLRSEVPRILSSIGGAAARDALSDNLFEPDVALRTQIVAGLSRLHARHPDLPVDQQTIEMVLTAEIMGHYRSYQIVGKLGTTFDSDDPVAQGLRHAMDQEQERILRLLDPLLPNQDMKSVYLALHAQSTTLRANALELLDNVLSPHLRALVVPLFDGQVSLAERVRLANRYVGTSVDSEEQAALAMLASEDAWLKACGAYAAGALRLANLRPQLETLAEGTDPLLRETARTSLLRLASPVTVLHAAPFETAAVEEELTHPGETFGVG